MGDDEELAFNLVDAFSVPRFTYCEERKKYIADDALGKPGPKLFAGKGYHCEIHSTFVGEVAYIDTGYIYTV